MCCDTKQTLPHSVSIHPVLRQHLMFHCLSIVKSHIQMLSTKQCAHTLVSDHLFAFKIFTLFELRGYMGIFANVTIHYTIL